jgi:hypothetical protein
MIDEEWPSAFSVLRECPVHGVGEVGDRRVQIARRRRNSGVPHEQLDDVHVLAPAHEVGGVGVIGDRTPLTGSDRSYLAALAPLLETYPEVRMDEE